MTKISKTYEEVYSDASCGIIRSESDASIAGRHNGADCVVVCDRKWGECTPSATSIEVLCAFSFNSDYGTITSKSISNTKNAAGIIKYSGTGNWTSPNYDELLEYDDNLKISSSSNGNLYIQSLEAYNYEVVGLYTDSGGTTLITGFDAANFSAVQVTLGSYTSQKLIGVLNSSGSSVSARTARIKITPKEA